VIRPSIPKTTDKRHCRSLSRRYGVVGAALKLGWPAGAGLFELAAAYGAVEAGAPALEAAGLVALPLTLLFAPVAEFMPPAAGLVALIPGPFGMSDPAGPGTELPTGPEPLDPMPPLLPPAAPDPIPPPAPPAPTPPAPCANAFALNVAIASVKVAPSNIVDRFFFIALTPP
jgi:hypothetical protein